MKKEDKKEVKDKEEYVKWFSELGKDDVLEVGGKGANLGEMYNLGLPVPPGFCIVAGAYKYFLEKNKLDEEIYKMLKKLDVNDTEELEKTADKIRERIKNAEMPEELREEIIEAYDHLSPIPDGASALAAQILKQGKDDAFVAVRSSATAEDSSEASFAGQHETFLNVKGKSKLIDAVKGCFASLFTARSVYYRIKKGYKHENVLLAVVVQRMINSDKSGVLFSRDPITGKDEVVVESVFGLGEGIVSGAILPDHYVVSRNLDIKDEKINEKKIAVVRMSDGSTKKANLSPTKSSQEVLRKNEVKKLANYAIQLEEHYGKPQDIEFAIESNEIYIVQTRPITTIAERGNDAEDSREAILSGIPASPGRASGSVKIVKDMNDLAKIKQGDILVTKMTNPDMVVSMQKANAIVTDEGGMTCHAAIVSREMGIPSVVATEKATKILKDGEIVSVDGGRGKVYRGELKSNGGESNVEKVEIKKIVETKTKIKVMIDLPDFVERASRTECNSVGLLRLEGIIASSGKHPVGFLNHIEKYGEILAKGISKIAEHFEEIWVRTSDIRSDEFINLEGAPKEKEINPMLGMHGIRFSLKNPLILKAELLAVKKVAEETGKKLGIMLPQVISVDEVSKTKEIFNELNLTGIKLGVMIETPAAVEIISELAPLIDFISFGTNDLTQYTLAIDRGNGDVQYLYDELHPAVLSQLKKVIEICKENNVESSICGQAGSNKEMVKFLIDAGIDSISVNADVAHEISVYVRELETEKELVKEVDSEENKEQLEKDKLEEIEDKLDEDIEKNDEIIEDLGLKENSKEEIVEELNGEILQEPKEEIEINEEVQQVDEEEPVENISEELGEELEIF
ncbi:phosphoenolpyruvate synthase [Candidatus Woesearchaeota archaeon CG10_big_fil_rev_8_21_14_0_10_34_12]|nr:MAG: phosphoenolpyruvate synthase [Candidatus Woesearchaeota archaeon CG10_big_fil_rev_8_21_14_0_10_34_12]